MASLPGHTLCPHAEQIVLKETLLKSGVITEVKARIRAEVHNVLLGKAEPPVPLSNENLRINELIREYLIFNGYRCTESVLMAETGQPEFSLGRDFLQQQLNVKPKGDSASVPLLYSLVGHFSEKEKIGVSMIPSLSPPSKLNK